MFFFFAYVWKVLYQQTKDVKRNICIYILIFRICRASLETITYNASKKNERICKKLWWTNDELLEKYNTIWDKVSADIKKEFDSKPIYNKLFWKTKIKSHGDEVTDFYDKKKF